MIEQEYPRLKKAGVRNFNVLDGVFCELLDAIIQCYLLDEKHWTKRMIWDALYDYSKRVLEVGGTKGR